MMNDEEERKGLCHSGDLLSRNLGLGGIDFNENSN
jgi:hypothetical protein